MTDYTEAACRGCDPETWFADDRHRADRDEAIRICHGCPIKAGCLQDALTEEAGAVGSRQGIRGGLTPLQRERLGPRATRKRAA